MDGQISMEEYLSHPDWPKEIVRSLKEHCEHWGYEWMTQIQENKTAERFHRLFCNVTRSYYVCHAYEMYHVRFERENQVTIKRCGHDYDYRGFDAVISLEDVLKEL